MLFQSLTFFVFAAATLLLYWRFPRARLGILALANALFYLAAGLVTWGWVLFRAATVDDAAAMMLAMADPRGLASLATVKTYLLVALGLYGLHWLEWWARRDEVALGRWWVLRVPVPAQGLALAALALGMMGTYASGQDFICFRF